MSDSDLNLNQNGARGPSIAELAQELDGLRRSYGATIEAIDARAPTLRELGAEHDPGDPARAARELLVLAAQDLGNAQYSLVADVALGLTVTGKSMADRLRKVAAVNSRIDLSDATVKRLRGDALSALAGRLFARSRQTITPMQDFSEITLGRTDIAPFTVEETDTWVRFAPGRQLESYIVRIRLMAHATGRQIHTTHYSFFEDLRAEQLSIRPMFGCKTYGQPYDDGGVHFEDVELSNYMHQGDSADLMYEVLCASPNAMAPIVMVTAATDGRRSGFSVQFADDAHPDYVWRFAGLTYLDARSSTLGAQRKEDLGDGTFIQVAHSDIRKGLGYGISWDWD